VSKILSGANALTPQAPCCLNALYQPNNRPHKEASIHATFLFILSLVAAFPPVIPDRLHALGAALAINIGVVAFLQSLEIRPSLHERALDIGGTQLLSQRRSQAQR
jgi:hypothetical protein